MPLTPAQQEIVAKNWKRPSLRTFIYEIFSKSFPKEENKQAGIIPFIGGRHVNWTSAFLQNNPWTMRISAKNHFKSVSLYAMIMWDMFVNHYSDIDCHYFSFQEHMAAYHGRKIKTLISNNPYFQDFHDCKPTAEGVMDYTLGEDEYGVEHHFKLTPHGILGFKRGLHCARVYGDDLLQDPAQRIDPAIVHKVNYIVKSQLIDIPTKPAPYSWLHIVGTAQTEFDFYFDRGFQRRFRIKIMPGILDETNKEVLWPEWQSYEDLCAKREEMGPKNFSREYMCAPVHSEDMWFSKTDIDKIVVKSEKEYEKVVLSAKERVTVGGWDLGKKNHPAYACIFEEVSGRAWMRWERWFDGVEYLEQLRTIKKACKRFYVDKLWFDNTRGDMETEIERGNIPGYMEPKVENRENKFSQAQELDKRVRSDPIGIKIFNNHRTIQQLLVVDNDLKAMVTPSGHGDSFVGMRMAMGALAETTGRTTKQKLYFFG